MYWISAPLLVPFFPADLPVQAHAQDEIQRCKHVLQELEAASSSGRVYRVRELALQRHMDRSILFFWMGFKLCHGVSWRPDIVNMTAGSYFLGAWRTQSNNNWLIDIQFLLKVRLNDCSWVSSTHIFCCHKKQVPAVARTGWCKSNFRPISNQDKVADQKKNLLMPQMRQAFAVKACWSPLENYKRQDLLLIAQRTSDDTRAT